ncbi:MAG TPA: serine hydrolase domain-containing protein [Gaiellales bacterium]
MTLAIPGPGGSVAPGYGRVRDAFARAAGGGACAFAAEVDGERVCDLWAGEGFGGDSATVLYSGTKGVVATALLLLVERGELDLDAPVSALWPEFAARGKGAVTVTDVLAHSAGLPAVERPLARTDLGRPRFLAAELAAQAPMVPPGAPTYHAVTWGWLAGELVLRLSGLSAGAYVREHLADPLRIDLRIGLSPDDPLAARLVRPRPASGYRLTAFMAAEPDPRLALVYGNPAFAVEDWADPDLRAIEAPAVNGVATARAMATLYGRIAGGMLAPATVRRGREPAREGADPLTGRALRYGPTGYELFGTPSALGPAADAFGHTGAGGGSHGAWPSLRTGFSFLTADLRSQDADGRAAEVLAALHAAVTGT